MDEKLKEELKKSLLKEKEDVIEELSTVAKPDKGEHVAGDFDPKHPDYGSDKSDDPEGSPIEVEDYEVNVDVTNKLQTRLNGIEEALSRIEKADYGVCEKCGQDIDEERLKANAAALTCVKCG